MEHPNGKRRLYKAAFEVRNRGGGQASRRDLAARVVPIGIRHREPRYAFATGSDLGRRGGDVRDRYPVAAREAVR